MPESRKMASEIALPCIYVISDSPDVVKLCGMRIQCTVDVAEAAFLADLGEDHACKLIPAFEMLAAVIAFVLVGNALELVAGQQFEELGDNEGMARHWTCSATLNGLS
jgi:hypothetical protein